MRRFTLMLALLAPFLAPTRPAVADETGSAMADAAGRFLAALDDTQRAKASFAFESPERTNWHWIPRERQGVPIKAMTSEQRALAFGLLNTGLSTAGSIKATTIMSLEGLLKEMEHGTGPVRDPELYFFSVFGEPGPRGNWGWRVEGHHLALNYTLVNGRGVSATPFMFGSNPAEVKAGPRKGLRNLADIEGPANALMTSLSLAQRKLAIVAEVAPEVTTTPNSEQVEGLFFGSSFGGRGGGPLTDQPSARGVEPANLGIGLGELNDDQRALLMNLLNAYGANFPESLRGEILGSPDKDVLFRFAWYGPTDPTKPHAFRVTGQTVLIDFNDTQNETNHIHTFYRRVQRDFGNQQYFTPQRSRGQ